MDDFLVYDDFGVRFLLGSSTFDRTAKTYVDFLGQRQQVQRWCIAAFEFDAKRDDCASGVG